MWDYVCVCCIWCSWRSQSLPAQPQLKHASLWSWKWKTFISRWTTSPKPRWLWVIFYFIWKQDKFECFFKYVCSNREYICLYMFVWHLSLRFACLFLECFLFCLSFSRLTCLFTDYCLLFAVYLFKLFVYFWLFGVFVYCLIVLLVLFILFQQFYLLQHLWPFPKYWGINPRFEIFHKLLVKEK